MKSFLNPYTVDKSRPVDPVTLHILSVVNRVAAELKLPYIVVGATARDLLLFHVFGIPVTRATADVDFAVAMDSWERFHELRAALLASGHFREGKMEHRVYLKALSLKDEIPVDLIPFGGVAEADVIHWPPDRETMMAVVGFVCRWRREARSWRRYDAAVLSRRSASVRRLREAHLRRSRAAVPLYFLFSIPWSRFVNRIGYHRTMVV
jgi:hypothetical protein